MNQTKLALAWDAVQKIVRQNFEHEYYKPTKADYKEFVVGKNEKVSILDGGARYWKAIKTGEVGEIITQVHTRETKEQKEQRVRLNNAVTPEVANTCSIPVRKLFRAKGQRRAVKAPDAGSEALLKARVDKFHAGQSLYSWAAENFVRYNEIDPNAWWVLLFDQHKNDDGTVVAKPTPRPVVFPSENVVYFNEEAEFLCVRTTGEGRDLDNGTAVAWNQWTLYAPGFTVTAVEESNTEDFAMVRALAEMPRPADGIKWPVENRSTYVIDRMDGQKPATVYVEFLKTDSIEAPFGRFGVMPDERNAGRTRASLYAPAKEVFDELVQLQSEAETNRAAHVFFKKHIRADKCTHAEDGHGRCIGGKMTGTKANCPMCEGTGLVMHRSGTDVVIHAMPEDKSEHIPLADMFAYEEHSLAPLEHLMEQIEKGADRAMKAIWGVSAQARTVSATVQGSQQMTATEFRGRYEMMNNALAPFREGAMEMVKKLVRLTANYAEIGRFETNSSGFKTYPEGGTGVEVTFDIPESTESPNLDELTLSRLQARTAGAPVEVLAGIDLEIIEAQFGIDSEKAQWFKAKSAHRPFTGKSEEEIAVIIAARPDGDYFKTLWLYFDDIFEEIQMEDGPLFLQKNLAQQKEVVKQKVATLQEIEKQNVQQVARPGVIQ